MTPRAVHRPRPASARAIYMVLLVSALIFMGLIAGLWYTLSHDSGVTARFKEGLRLPQTIPDWLIRSSGSIPGEMLVRNDRMLPYLILRWKNCLDTAPSPIDVLLGLTYGEMDVDLEGERSPVVVDGVQGWLWHLGSLDFARQFGRGDFASPYSYEEVYEAFIQDWQYDRSVYIAVQDARYNTRPLSGPAIALQWNREGINYLLIAQDRGTITADVLLQIAGSMAPSKYPTIAEIGGMGLRCPP